MPRQGLPRPGVQHGACLFPAYLGHAREEKVAGCRGGGPFVSCFRALVYDLAEPLESAEEPLADCGLGLTHDLDELGDC